MPLLYFVPDQTSISPTLYSRDTPTLADMVYTASFAFFEAIWEAGITHCFVNLGSDHPSIIEAIVKGQNEKKGQFPKIITCPNEMVALSMADGYARLTGKPQCVIVHVDVGTQGLGAAVHNASCGRAPVLIFAGLSPFTIEGEMRGSRTEYIHWIQDVPDQKQIVAQYCRYTGEIKTGKNVKQLVNRALTWATSDPQGPVYLCGAREPLEEDLTPYSLKQEYWHPVEPTALPTAGVEIIANALAEAKKPLVITGYSGRNHKAVDELVRLADNIKGLRVLDTGGSDMCFPANHPAWLGLRFGSDPSIETADVILVLDCDVPWINTQCHPNPDAKIFHVDTDPLKQQMPVFYLDALRRYRADSFTSLSQLNTYLTTHLSSTLSSDLYTQRWTALQKSHSEKLASIADLAKVDQNGHYGTPYLAQQLKKHCPEDTIWAIEAVTQTVFVADQLQATLPGSWLNCGGGGLGWSGGGALGIKLATDAEGKKRFVCQIVGDGTYLFTVPGSVYWISKRYNIPILTIVLNNKGWNAPKRSLLLVHPDGEGSKVSNEELNISFTPTPDYSGIAKAASGGEIWAGHASTAEELEKLLPEAIKTVLGGKSAVLDAHLEGPDGKYVGDDKKM
ncbi:thiamine diphosphate-binding protein [Sporormia fimetaria CBS 119925]|uniref:Thiamine diphosphate-binding protein n=1 Tax=Sporormia fimetaria CBS 119925 TaxID=1340428 RepID=A0A6A6UVZ1_9PLEO|nr:thiamine diphosphate-binding protein [Sporormia fimetaria CBS 119925]